MGQTESIINESKSLEEYYKEYKLACGNNNIEDAKKILEESKKVGKMNIHQNNEEIFTNACRQGYIEIVKHLIEIKNA